MRVGSESKLPAGCHVIIRDPFDPKSLAEEIRPADTFVQLLGWRARDLQKPKSFEQLIWNPFALLSKQPPKPILTTSSMSASRSLRP